MQKATTTRNTGPDSRSFKSATTPTDGSGSQPRHKSGAQPDHRGSRQHHIQTRPSRLEAGKDQTRPPTTLRGPSQQSQRGSSMRGTWTTRSRQGEMARPQGQRKGERTVTRHLDMEWVCATVTPPPTGCEEAHAGIGEIPSEPTGQGDKPPTFRETKGTGESTPGHVRKG